MVSKLTDIFQWCNKCFILNSFQCYNQKRNCSMIQQNYHKHARLTCLPGKSKRVFDLTETCQAATTPCSVCHKMDPAVSHDPLCHTPFMYKVLYVSNGIATLNHNPMTYDISDLVTTREWCTMRTLL